MARLMVLALLAGLSGCAYDNYTGNQNCLQNSGCESSFPASGYGPVHAQAVAADAPSPLQPQD